MKIYSISTDVLSSILVALPYHRGGTPIQNQIIRGVKTTDVNLITMEKQLDAGDIYCKQTISLQGSLRDIWMIISDTAAELIKKCIDHDLKPAPQPEVRGHTFKRIKTKPLDFLAKDDIIQVYDEIRMLDAENYPSCYIEIGEYRLEFSRAKIEEDNIISDVRIFKNKRILILAAHPDDEVLGLEQQLICLIV